MLHRLVEDQVEAQGANNNAAVQNTEDANNAEGEDGSSILESLRKRICQGRERLREVRIVRSEFSNFYIRVMGRLLPQLLMGTCGCPWRNTSASGF